MDNTNEQRSSRERFNQQSVVHVQEDAALQHLPSLPPADARGQETCAIIQLYLGIWDELSSEQRESVMLHVRSCPACAQEYQLLIRTTRLIGQLPASEPSLQVDRAIRAALAQQVQRSSRTNGRLRRSRSSAAHTVPWSGGSGFRQARTRVMIPAAAALVAIALLFVALFSGSSVWPWQSQQSFALPANLSWSSYVLLQKQTMMSSSGPYEVTTYHDVQDQQVKIETRIAGQLDVVVVKDAQKSLGLDMMHHVAQWNASGWDDSGTVFNLTTLRNQLASGQAKYLGKGQFRSQPVYQIKIASGDILLLDMHYMPVNMLKLASASGQAAPMYDAVEWLHPDQVSSSMWDMNIPPGFQMGELPSRPA